MKASGSQQQNKNILFVGEVPTLTSDAALFSYFLKFGEVVKVRIVKEKKTKIPKGYAYVTMFDSRTVPYILSQVHYLGDRKIDVQLAANKGEKRFFKSEKSKRRIYVANLPRDITDEKLKGLFGQFGQVHNAYVIHDLASLSYRKYGYVEFEDPADAAWVQKEEIYLNGDRLQCLAYLGKYENMATNNDAWADQFQQSGSRTFRSHTADWCHDPSNYRDRYSTLQKDFLANNSTDSGSSPSINKHFKKENGTQLLFGEENTNNYRFNIGGPGKIASAYPATHSTSPLRQAHRDSSSGLNFASSLQTSTGFNPWSSRAFQATWIKPQ